MVFFTSCGNTVSSVDGQFIDNGYNNLVFNNGSLVRINNSLFYNYNETNDILHYGLYEITASGCEKIKVPEGFVLSDNLQGMQGYQEQLLIGSADTADQHIEAYSLKNHSFSSINLFTDRFEQQIKQYYVFGDAVYAVTDSEVYKVFKGKVEKLLDRSAVKNLNEQPYSNETDIFCGMCFTKDHIYYIHAESNCMCSLDTKSLETNELFDMELELSKLNLSEDHLDYQFMVIDNNIIFSCAQDNTITRFYAYNVLTKSTRQIDAYFDGLTHINAFNGQLVLGNEEDGLYLYDLETGDIQKVMESSVSEIYVVDDKYIYFKKPSRNLYRINPANGKTEKIY